MGLLRPYFKSNEYSFSETGAFGDSFAPMIGLISALALIVAICSIAQQTRELRIQRMEIRAQRRASSESVNLLREQVLAMQALELAAREMYRSMTEQPFLEIEAACIRELEHLRDDVVGRLIEYRQHAAEYFMQCVKFREAESLFRMTMSPPEQIGIHMDRRTPPRLSEYCGKTENEASHALGDWVSWFRKSAIQSLLEPTLVHEHSDPHSLADRHMHLMWTNAPQVWGHRCRMRVNRAMRDIEQLAEIRIHGPEASELRKGWRERVHARLSGALREIQGEIRPHASGPAPPPG